MKFKCLASVVFVAILATWTVSALPGRYSKTYREAVRLYENGMFDRARVLFEGISSQAPEDPMSAGYALMCAIRQKAAGYEESIDSYTRTYGCTPLSSPIHQIYAVSLFDDGRYQEAAREFDQVNSKGLSRRDYTEILFKRAYCDYAVGEYEAAREGFDKVLKRPASEFTAPSHYAKGFMDYSENRFAQAFPEFEAAAKDSRFEQQALYYMLECKFMEKDYAYVAKYGDEMYEKVPEERKARLARILSESYLVQGNAGKAKKYYDAAVAEKPVTDPTDAFYAGSLQYSLGDWKAAIENFNKMGERRDSVGQIASYQLGYSYIQTKDKVSAMNAFKEAAGLDFDKRIKEDAFFNYAKLAFDLNHDSSAFKDYLARYKETGRNDQVYDYIAVASLFNRDYAGAVEAYDNIENLTPEMKSNYMKANYLRAEQLISNGSWRDAIPCLKAATFFAPRQDNFNKLSRYWLAESQYKTGNYEEARNGFTDLYNQSALDNKAEGKRLPYDLAYCHFDEGAYASAANWFDRYIASGDKTCREDALTRRADCDFITKNYKSAVDGYAKVLSEYPKAESLYPRFQQGVAYGLLGKTADKIATLAKARNASPSAPFYAESLYELGRTYVSDDKDKQAEDCFKTLLSRSKDSLYLAKSLIELGMLERNRSDYDKALEYYKRVAQTFRGSEAAEDAMLAIESIYQSKGEPEKYLAYAESLGRSAKTAEEKELLFFNSAEQIFMAGNYEKALVALDKYLSLYPDGAKLTPATYYKAECYKSLGAKEKACDCYAAVIHAPDAFAYKELSLLNFARLSYGMEHWSEALAAYTTLQDEASSDETRLTAKAGKMRSAYFGRKFKEAVDAAKEVLADGGADGTLTREAKYLTAKSLLATSQRDAAFDVLRGLSRDPSTAEGAEAAYLVIQDLFDRGRFNEVESAVYKFAQDAPNQAYWLARSFIVLGDSFAENENYRQAKATFESILNGYETADGKPDDIIDNVKLRLSRLEEMMSK